MSSIEIILSVLISLFLLGGCFFIFTGVLGIVRFPDVYCRMHAATKGPTLGMMLLMIASMIFFATMPESGGSIAKALLVIAFILITNPIGAHMLSKYAYLHGTRLWHKSVRDDWGKQDIPDKQD